MDVDAVKRTVRERVWAALDAAGVVSPPGAAGHIPSFDGAAEAAGRLAALEPWAAAGAIKANPDRAQLPVRQIALRDDKLLYMAVPKIASLRPFYRLDPTEIGVDAAHSKRAAEVAPRVLPAEMRPLDMVVCGTVAVDRSGTRIGKGAGYSDMEMGLLTEAGVIGPQTVIVTTVHQLQVMDEQLPHSEHDFPVDLIVTPDEVIRCASRPRPTGLYWEHLSPEQVSAIPILGELQRRRGEER